MSHPSSSKKITDRIAILEDNLAMNSFSVKSSIEELTDFVKPRQILQRTIDRSFRNKLPNDFKIKIAIGATYILANKYLVPKTRNIFIKTAIMLLPYLAMKKVTKNTD